MHDALGMTSPRLLAHTDHTVAEAMHEIARQVPDRVALESGADRITFGELEARANGVADALLDRGLGHDTPVLLLCDHGVEPPVAILGVLHAGLIAAPVDVKAPGDRLAQLLAVSGAEWILSDGEHAGLARSLTDRVVVLDDLGATAGTRPDVAIDDEHPGLILFTSGSTGTPKGVWLRHRSIVPTAVRGRGRPVGEHERLALTASWGFTAAQNLLFRALFNGLTACAYDLRTRGARGLAEWIRDAGITELQLQPSILRAFADETSPGTMASLQELTFGGDTLHAADVRAAWPLVGPDTRLRNSLGSTEAGGIVAWYLPRDVDLPDGPVPVGHPREGVTIRLVDEDGDPVPDGEPGRIVVIGNGYLAGGYWRDPELTAACFFREPDGREGFRSSDRGRWRDDGMLEHLGRLDSRVKVRGAMVATSEVETTLMGLDGVADATVIAVPDDSAGTRLVAYVVANGSVPLSVWRLRRDVATRVPTTMVPSTFVALEAIPRNLRNKVDRAALPPPPPFTPPPYREPTGADAALADIFADVLGLERVGLDDDFFELGGDSLGVIELLAAIADELGVELAPTAVLEAPTVEQLAIRIAQRGASGSPLVVPLRTGTAGSVFFCIPGGGGAVIALRRLADAVEDHDVYAIQPFGLEQPGPPDRTIKALARRNIAAMRTVCPDGPYRLGGYSFGGIVAFEMACALRATGDAVDLLAVLDTRAPRRDLGSRARARTEMLRADSSGQDAANRSVLAVRWMRFGARWLRERARRRMLVAGLRRDPGHGSPRYRAFLRHHQAMAHKYEPSSTFDGPVLVVRARAHGDDLGWSKLATGPVHVVEVPAPHLDLLRSPAVETVGRHLSEALHSAARMTDLDGTEPASAGGAESQRPKRPDQLA